MIAFRPSASVGFTFPCVLVIAGFWSVFVCAAEDPKKRPLVRSVCKTLTIKTHSPGLSKLYGQASLDQYNADLLELISIVTPRDAYLSSEQQQKITTTEQQIQERTKTLRQALKLLIERKCKQ